MGSFLTIGQQWNVAKGGNRGDGSFIWFGVESEVGPFYVGPINTPSSRAEQTQLWDLMMENLLQGTWLIEANLNQFHGHQGRRQRWGK